MRVEFYYGPNAARILATTMDNLPVKGDRIEFGDRIIISTLINIRPDVFKDSNRSILLEVEFRSFVYTENGFYCQIFLS